METGTFWFGLVGVGGGGGASLLAMKSAAFLPCVRAIFLGKNRGNRHKKATAAVALRRPQLHVTASPSPAGISAPLLTTSSQWNPYELKVHGFGIPRRVVFPPDVSTTWMPPPMFTR